MSGSQSLNSLITGGWGSSKSSVEGRVAQQTAKLEADQVLAEKINIFEKDGSSRYSSLREEEVEELIKCGFSASVALTKLLLDTRSREKTVPLPSLPHLRVDTQGNPVAYDQPPPSISDCGGVVERSRAVLSHADRPVYLSSRYGLSPVPCHQEISALPHSVRVRLPREVL